jgi:HlyD family secretion protein
VKKEKITKTQEIVFIIKDGKAKKVDVETGLSNDNFIAVTKGLEGGEEVVSGSYKAISRELNDGMQVRVEEKRSKISQK